MDHVGQPTGEGNQEAEQYLARTRPLPKSKAAAYFRLTKPWIIVLLLVTTLGGMLLASPEWPSFSLIVATLFGGFLAAGGASALNSYVDRDVDGVMSRTRRRPTVTGSITPRQTLLFGLALSAASILEMWLLVNPLAALLSLAGIFYYVGVYTLYLKRSTPQNIVIGGAAGAIPPMVGWAAVQGHLSLLAVFLFVIIFYWTPPHTWALALLVQKDYTKANIPMLPVVMGEDETRKHILLYSLLLVVLTLLPFSVHLVGPFYLVSAFVLGIGFILLAAQLWRDHQLASAKRLYKYSTYYLALLFTAMVIDHALAGWLVI
jgi:protoheme IX farnesyltransferase